jgi:hypothetical protein
MYLIRMMEAEKAEKGVDSKEKTIKTIMVQTTDVARLLQTVITLPMVKLLWHTIVFANL